MEIENNMRQADDTVIITTSWEDLQELKNHLHVSSNEHVIYVNPKKTKYQVIDKEPINLWQMLVINKTTIKKYQYLGTIIDEENTHTIEISKQRLQDQPS